MVLLLAVLLAVLLVVLLVGMATSIAAPLVAADSYCFLACTLGTNATNAVVSGAVAYDITAGGSTPQ